MSITPAAAAMIRDSLRRSEIVSPVVYLADVSETLGAPRYLYPLVYPRSRFVWLTTEIAGLPFVARFLHPRSSRRAMKNGLLDVAERAFCQPLEPPPIMLAHQRHRSCFSSRRRTYCAGNSRTSMPRARSLSELETLELHPAVTFVIGENGSGKSTLLEAIAVAWGFIRRAARTIFASTLAHLILSVDYYETEHYSVTRNFLADPKRMLNILLEPDGPAPAPAKGETAL